MKKKILFIILLVILIFLLLINRSGYIIKSIPDSYPVCPPGMIPLSDETWKPPRNQYIHTKFCGDGSFSTSSTPGSNVYYTSNTVSPIMLYYNPTNTVNVPVSSMKYLI